MNEIIQKTIAATAKEFNVAEADILSNKKNQPFPKCRMIVILILDNDMPKEDIMEDMNVTRHNYQYYLKNGREELADYFDMQAVYKAVVNAVADDLAAYRKEVQNG